MSKINSRCIFQEDGTFEREEDEQEPESDYDIGGYHPVNPGDVFDSRSAIYFYKFAGHFRSVQIFAAFLNKFSFAVV